MIPTPLKFNSFQHAVNFWEKRKLQVEKQILILLQERQNVISNLKHNKQMLFEKIQKEKNEL